MSTISPPLPVKLFVGMLSRDLELFSICAAELSRDFGPTDFRSPSVPWFHTGYYAAEMGTDLLRQFVFFEKTVDPDLLVEVKYRAVEIERTHAELRGDILRRSINIDPGYVTEAKVVLATAKDFPHRVSIGKGVYAESTLRYSKDARIFVAMEHTYPDFRTEQVRRWFTDARERLRKVLPNR